MSLTSLANTAGMWISSLTPFDMGSNGTLSTMNAVGESGMFIGKIQTSDGASHVLSGAGSGKIYWKSGVTTFANAGTTLRVGVQDVASTGLEDGTFDVYKDLVGVTDTISGSSIIKTTMATGTKTIADGDLVAVGMEMIAWAGADSITFSSFFGNSFSTMNFPYATRDQGTLAKYTSAPPSITIIFDDGAAGWIHPFYMGYNYGSNPSVLSFASNTTPDEYAAVFKLPYKASLNQAALMIGNAAIADTYEVILYSDPLGTPVAERTVSVDPNYSGVSGTVGPYFAQFSSYILKPNTYYAVAARPTTTNSIDIGYFDLGSGNDSLKIPSVFGNNILLSSRTDQTGAFAEVQTYYLPALYLNINKLDNGFPVPIVGG
mgnify:CR=1 FL=1